MARWIEVSGSVGPGNFFSSRGNPLLQRLCQNQGWRLRTRCLILEQPRSCFGGCRDASLGWESGLKELVERARKGLFTSSQFSLLMQFVRVR